MDKQERPIIGLCHRCDYRAQFKEKGYKPRYECGTNSDVYSCYMYRPVMPILIKRNKEDKRPMFSGYAFSARSHRSDKEPKMELEIKKTKEGHLLYWVPTKERKNK